MKRFLCVAFILAPILGAQTRPAAAPGLPPLIDRELLFGNPEIAAAQLSPDGKHLAFVKPWKGVLNIWVKQTGEPFSAARLLTAETHRPVSGYLWTRDGKSVCFVKDHDGDENFNLYVVDASAKPAEGADAPAARDLTGLKGVAVQLYSAPKKDPDTIYIGINDRDRAWHDLYKVKLSTGERTLLRKNTEKIASWIFDLDGQLRLALRTADNGDQETLRADADAFTRIYSCNLFETCGPLRFTKDGKHVYYQTNQGDANDLSALVLLDPETGKTEAVESDPLKRVDLGGVFFSEATGDLAFTSYPDDRVRRYFRDKSYEADFKWLESKLPGMEISIGSETNDAGMWLLNAYSDREPGETYLFDRKARALTLQFRTREELPRKALAAMQSIRYESSDGMSIPAYLVLPQGMAPKNLPLVVVPHGGPWTRDSWGYNPLAQFLANRGYAVLMPNFRGSTGYGKKFLNAGNGEWGRKMQDDLTWGVKHLIAQGTVDPKRVGIMGGSYGGYAVLAGLAFTPELYRVGVDIVGPSNLSTLLDSIPPYWEAGRKLMYARMADPVTPAGKAWLKERSPLFEASKIKAALMVAQGGNDPRVNRAESEQIVAALRDRGFAVEYLMAPDEGHGFVRTVNTLALFMAAEKFLAKQLDGRYQEGGNPEVVKRLAEITVNPKTVIVTKNLDPATIAAPKPATDLQPGTYQYKTSMVVNGREFAMTTTTTVKDENGAWEAEDTTETPAGRVVDRAILEKGSLLVRKRTMSQGAATLEVEFKDGKATGALKMDTQSRPISAALDGPPFADAAGSMLVIGCLPLADNYSLTYRNFDLQRQKTKLVRLAVTGSEKVTVPAGTFEAFRVEITAADGGAGDRATIWIDKASRRPVKASTTSPAGAIATSELVK